MLHTVLVLLAITAPEREDRLIVAAPYPAFLGVGFNAEQPDDGVAIGQIREGTAAAKAGLEVGDVITRFNGKDVRDHMSVRAAIQQHRAGDKVELRVRRGANERNMTVVLGRPPLPEEMLIQRDPPRVRGGTIEGSLKFTGSVEHQGNYILTGNGAIGEDFQIGWGSVFDVLIEDRANHAVLDVGGNVELSGMLYVGKSNLQFKLGDSFEILRGAKSIKGQFTTLWLPPLPEGLAWKVDYDDLSRRMDRNKNGKHDVTIIVVKK